MRYIFFLFIFLLSISFVSANSIEGGDMVVEISQVDSGNINSSDISAEISMTDRFINDIIIGVYITPITPGGGGGGGGGYVNQIDFYKRNEQNTSYIHITQLNNTQAEFKVYINYTTYNTLVSLFIIRNEENMTAYQMRPDFDNSFIVIYTNEKMLPRDVLKYYIQASDGIRVIRTPIIDYDIYIWRYMARFNKITLMDLMYIIIIIILSTLWFLLVLRRQKKPKTLNTT